MKTHVVIHHSISADDAQTMSWDAIKDFHVKTNGWDDIGYHLGVELVDGVYVGLLGRPMLANAAAARGMNACGYHVMFTGNFDAYEPEIAMLKFAARHVASICEALRIPSERIIGHRDVVGYDWKTCPGVRFDLAKFRTLVDGAM